MAANLKTARPRYGGLTTGRTAAVDLSPRATRHRSAALLLRHGPMVIGVLRRVMRHVQEAEDAFQATFLVPGAQGGVGGAARLGELLALRGRLPHGAGSGTGCGPTAKVREKAGATCRTPKSTRPRHWTGCRCWMRSWSRLTRSTGRLWSCAIWRADCCWCADGGAGGHPVEPAGQGPQAVGSAVAFRSGRCCRRC